MSDWLKSEHEGFDSSLNMRGWLMSEQKIWLKSEHEWFESSLNMRFLAQV